MHEKMIFFRSQEPLGSQICDVSSALVEKITSSVTMLYWPPEPIELKIASVQISYVFVFKLHYGWLHLEKNVFFQNSDA